MAKITYQYDNQYGHFWQQDYGTAYYEKHQIMDVKEAEWLSPDRFKTY